MNHHRGSRLAVVDLETTGTTAGKHEIVQIAVVPLNDDLNPTGQHFYANICPEFSERADPKSLEINGLTLDELEGCPDAAMTASLLDEWVQSLGLHTGCRLIPIAHNWVFEHSFLTAWLGAIGRESIFHYHPRDTMILALTINDGAALHGKPAPFKSVGLPELCKQLQIVNTKPHDALADCLAEAELYRKLLCW